MAPLLEVSNIRKSFGSLVANRDISFTVDSGEVLAILGENGAGKTTLMNIIFGHYLADEGVVQCAGRELNRGDPRAAIEAGIGMVHQHFTLAGESDSFGKHTHRHPVIVETDVVNRRSQTETCRTRGSVRP